ncbi:MAG: 23S rRNA (uracil(1939)-C(5))-methyltransferase RlmD [Selenomonadaceae bacterium]|nr:23S rRNA (uracil(1939)-C(5))-methyltransferase RlmD [Selenomonadaceae bacterium]
MKRDIPVILGKTYEINIESLGAFGEGVGRVDGFTVFIDGALKNEKVLGKVTEVKKNYAVCSLEKILEKSPDRIEPICPLFYECGGCQLQHLSYDAQLAYKYELVKDLIQRIGKIKDAEILPVLGAENPLHYRNKMQFPVKKEGGKVVIGCFKRGTHKVIDSIHCYIENESNNELVNAAREIINKLKIPVYDEDTHRGVIRHIMGRVGEKGALMAVIVTATKEFPKGKEFSKLLRERLPNLVSIHQNIQTYHNNVILGRDTVKLFGKETIYDKIGKLRFHISPRSFFQVNTKQAEVLYETALRFAGLTGNETVIDAYCGTGTISLFLAQKAKKVYGVEIVSSAIADAKKNARENNIRNAEFIVGDAIKVLPKLYKTGVRADVIVLDPPRAGTTEIVLETFARMQPNRIVYVSCNPATLARDLAFLETLNYKTKKIQPVDMFPQTNSVESVALVERA